MHGETVKFPVSAHLSPHNTELLANMYRQNSSKRQTNIRDLTSIRYKREHKIVFSNKGKGSILQ